MSYLSFVEYKGSVWSYVFVNPDIFGVSDRDRTHFMWNIVDLHKNPEDEQTRDIEGQNYGGRIIREKRCSLGSFCGMLFSAELDTPKGKRKPKVLLLEEIDSCLN